MPLARIIPIEYTTLNELCDSILFWKQTATREHRTIYPPRLQIPMKIAEIQYRTIEFSPNAKIIAIIPILLVKMNQVYLIPMEFVS